MARDRFYIGRDPYEKRKDLHLLGRNLDHEPTKDNECGYEIIAGPFDTEEEAREVLEQLEG